MSIYDEMQGVARDLLQQFNQGVIKLISIGPGAGPSYDPGPGTESSITLPGAVCRGVKMKYVMLGLAAATDFQVTMPGNLSPKLADFVEVDGKRLKVVNLITKPAAGTPVVHTVIIRA